MVLVSYTKQRPGKSERLNLHKRWLLSNEADVVRAFMLLWTTSAIYVFEGECDF